MTTSTKATTMPSETTPHPNETTIAGATPARSTRSGTSCAAIDVAAMLAMTATAVEAPAGESSIDASGVLSPDGAGLGRST